MDIILMWIYFVLFWFENFLIGMYLIFYADLTMLYMNKVNTKYTA